MENLQNTLPAGFIELLNLSSLTEKKAMLLVLNNDINTITTKHQTDINNSSCDELKPFVKYIPNFFNYTEYHDVLVNGVEAELINMKLYSPRSKEVKTQWINSKNRLYTYANKTHIPTSFDKYPCIAKLLDLVNSCPDTTGDLDACLITCYSTAKKSLSLHADDESDIDQNSSICSVSLGVNRTIEFARKNHKRRGVAPVEFSYDLEHGSMCIMRPGCQQALKHRVTPGVHIVNGNNVRYSISFRKLSTPVTSSTSIFNNSPIASSPVKDTIESFESLINNNNINNPTNTSASDILKSDLGSEIVNVIAKDDFKSHLDYRENVSVTAKENVSVIAGDSFTAKLDPHLLSRGKKRVINISRGGNRIHHVMDSLEDFYLVCPPQYNIDQVFICVGTNDIRNCKSNGVRHLRNPLLELLTKAKFLFPSAKVFLQTLLPLPIADFNAHYVVDNVLEFNALIDELCRKECVYILDVFWSFVEAGFRDPYYFPDNIRDCHPNRRGTGILARFYIEKIRLNRFNPYSS